jgi:hypothetical protein
VEWRIAAGRASLFQRDLGSPFTAIARDCDNIFDRDLRSVTFLGIIENHLHDFLRRHPNLELTES